MGLFNASATFLADLNLLFQIAVFISLLVSILLKYKLKYRLHGAIMGFTVMLHTGSILIVMVPSIIASRGLFKNPFMRLAFTTISHSILGSIVAIIGFYIVGKWMFNRLNTKNCSKNKRLMQIATFLWFIELIHGTFTYFLFYPI
jgi:uncharacterized membrane protein YozB (DUF420 family)